MKKGASLAILLGAVTVLLIILGTLFPAAAALYFVGGAVQTGSPATALGAAQNLGGEMQQARWQDAYDSLGNKAEFTEPEFYHDIKGDTLCLRTFATLQGFDVQPLHESEDAADVSMDMHWLSVLGDFTTTRQLHLVKANGKWSVDWPLVKPPQVPPQVIPVNYLRWDVIYPGPEDEWGTQSVQDPRVRIVDMRPLNRAAGMVVMGELLNEDVVPAFVSVRATLLRKDGSVIASADSLDMILHTLLPKQVTPYWIQFPGVDLSQVGSIRMQPTGTLVAASADPVVEVQNQKFDLTPSPALTGQLADQSGQTVNFAHVLSTFYDKNGQVVWVAGQYSDRPLRPQSPVPFRVPVPEDLSRQIASQRTVVATYLPSGAQ